MAWMCNQFLYLFSGYYNLNIIQQQQQYHNDDMNDMNDSSNNEIRKFQCSKCAKSSLVLKKVWDQQHHGFACDKCWTDIEGQRRYKCIVQ
jgi:hypothetical protein